MKDNRKNVYCKKKKTKEENLKESIADDDGAKIDCSLANSMLAP